MKIYLHSDRAERSASYRVHVCPAGDSEFHRADTYKSKTDRAGFPVLWLTPAGDPKEIEVIFVFGTASVDDELGRYMVERGIAFKHRMLRKIRMFFNRNGQPIEELFDEHGQRVLYEGTPA